MRYGVRVLMAEEHVLDGVLALLGPQFKTGGVSHLEASFDRNATANGANEVRPEPIVLDVVIVRKQMSAEDTLNGGIHNDTANGQTTAAGRPGPSPPKLSKRERDVLKLLADGMATKEVAFALSISCKTVGFHRGNIKNKLGLRSTAQLTRYAVAQGLV